MKTLAVPLIPFLAAGAFAFGAPAAVAAPQVGVQVAVNQDATGTNPGEAPRRIVLGQQVVYNERVATDRAGQTQILFLDESSMSIGPNADLLINQFVYDPQAGTGRLALSATRGVFRYIGGKLSKLEGAVTLGTSAASIGIRGGIMLLEVTPQQSLAAIFAYGRSLTVTGRDGTTRTITRPGYEVTVAGPGAAPSEPFPAPPGTIARLLALIDGQNGRHGGATAIPTDAGVAGSAPYADLSQLPAAPPDDFGFAPLPPVMVPPQAPIGREPRPGGGIPDGGIPGGGIPGVPGGAPTLR
ncbi:MAG TPA: hypothetical protein VJ770_12620 [Stellaceae bacterium]|nr:hypothetical protein [Stellaceae bacterium]